MDPHARDWVQVFADEQSFLGVVVADMHVQNAVWDCLSSSSVADNAGAYSRLCTVCADQHITGRSRAVVEDSGYRRAVL